MKLPTKNETRTEASPTQLQWSDTTVLSSDPQSPDHIVVTNPRLGKGGRVNAKTLIGNLLEGKLEPLRAAGFLGDTIEPAAAGRHRHWWHRGWETAFDYYLASRNTQYFDSFDADGEKRKAALENYLETEGECPARLCPAGLPQEIPHKVDLPEVSLGRALLARRTTQAFRKEPVDLATLSSLLWNGLARVRKTEQISESGSGSGSLAKRFLTSYAQAFEFYLVALDVNGLSRGAYYYDVKHHQFLPMPQREDQDLSKNLDGAEMRHLLCGNWAPETASFSIFLVADFARYQWRYRHERALRNLYFDAGRVAQEVLIFGSSLDLSALPTPAIRDTETAKWLGLDLSRSQPLYSLTFGRPLAQELGFHASAN